MYIVHCVQYTHTVHICSMYRPGTRFSHNLTTLDSFHCREKHTINILLREYYSSTNITWSPRCYSTSTEKKASSWLPSPSVLIIPTSITSDTHVIILHLAFSLTLPFSFLLSPFYLFHTHLWLCKPCFEWQVLPERSHHMKQNGMTITRWCRVKAKWARHFVKWHKKKANKTDRYKCVYHIYCTIDTVGFIAMHIVHLAFLYVLLAFVCRSLEPEEILSTDERSSDVLCFHNGK